MLETPFGKIKIYADGMEYCVIDKIDEVVFGIAWQRIMKDHMM